MKPGACQLEMLAAGRSRVSSFTRTLTIKSAVPSSSIIENALEDDEYEAKMTEHLRLAISSLINLQCVMYESSRFPVVANVLYSPYAGGQLPRGMRTPQWMQNTIIDALATLPLLQDFQLTVIRGVSPWLPPNCLSSLKRIAFSGVYDRSQVITTLVDAIAQNPDLTHMEIRIVLWDNSEEIPTLHELLARVPPDSPLRLEHLVLHHMFCRIDKFTLPHLRSLTFLDLSNFPRFPYPNYQSIQTTSISDPLNRVKLYHSTIADIFATLTRERIHLRGVIIQDLCNVVIDYLGSYSGTLEHLRVTYFRFDSTAESDALAERFYTSVLLKHAIAIRILHILPSHESGWCFNNQTMAAISQCKGLMSLGIALDSNGARRDGEVKFDDMVCLIV
jgi:hypothetical protein